LQVSCGGESSPHLTPGEVEYLTNFNDGQDNWQVGFADYPVGEETFYQQQTNWQVLPPALSHLNGLMVSGDNHSDDLFMFIKQQITGLKPLTRYQIRFELTIATNAAAGCAGVGGAPGEGVYIKAGASAIEPISEDLGTAYYLMNVDKGNQSVAGDDAINLGDFAGSKTDCFDISYEQKQLTSEGRIFTTRSDSEGRLWLLYGSDSGFEATTTIYYLESRVILRRIG
jgi:hypothetical protein